uniref:Uncharacterized protein n=1 Tax=Lactuca sativa TaxID=4236 RepID=A0A9R1XLE8_LACSA|nr:hypothetical protein LSAT_V11C300143310 [Lactuca sativa]
MDPNQNTPPNYRNYKPAETQPSSPPQPKKRKEKLVKTTHTNQSERVNWTKEEEDNVFYGLMGSESRNTNQINSKYGDLRLKCGELGGIYNNLSNLHKSESSNFNVFKAVMDQFEKIKAPHKPFPYLKPWDAPKWEELSERDFTNLFRFKAFKYNPNGKSQ